MRKKNYKKPKYYHHHHNNKNITKQKKNLMLDNYSQEEINNILFYSQIPQPEKINFEKKEELPKVEIPVIKAYELLQKNEVVEEEAIIPKQKKKKKINLNLNLNLNINKNILKYGTSFAVLLLVIFGTSYSYFNYTKEDSRQADISSGEVYVRLVENPQTMTLSKMYPRSDSEARSRNDNYFDFTIKAKNTSSTKPVLYSININNGEDVSGKTRIDPKYISVDLQEKVNNNYVYVKEGVTLDSYSFIGLIPTETNSEITKEYRVRLWINDDVIISDTDTNKTHNQTQFNNLFANFNISVNSEDKQVAYTMFKDSADTETVINFANISSDNNGKGLYVLPGTENDNFPIYYYRGEVDNNNVIFAGYCWKIVRTTDTGGIKIMLFSEVTENNTCGNNVDPYVWVGYANDHSSLSDVGYMYNKTYTAHTEGATSGAYFGSSVIYDDIDGNGIKEYQLISPVTSINSTHHYTCNLTTSSGTCATVRYYYVSGSNYAYIELTGGETIEDALYKMTGNGTSEVKARKINQGYKLNVVDSYMKGLVDSWFQTNFTNELDANNTDYRGYLEDTYYCNDRSYQTNGNYTYASSGWNPNGGSVSTRLYFNSRSRIDNNNWFSTTNTPSVTCSNITDRFSVGNRYAHLKYPVGLITADELVLAGAGGNGAIANSSFYLYYNEYYWTMTPSHLSAEIARAFYSKDTGELTATIVNYGIQINPMVSLKLGTQFEADGDGTPTNPYIVKYN